MSLLPLRQWLADTPWSIALHESLYMYPLLESVHVLTLCVFVGMSVLLDLRLLGHRRCGASRSPTVPNVSRPGCSSASPS